MEQETAEQLEEFRKQRAAAEHSLLETTTTHGGDPTLGSPVASSWMVKKKKRRRDHDGPEERAPDTKTRKLPSPLEDHTVAPTLTSPPSETHSLKEPKGASRPAETSDKASESSSAATTATKQSTPPTASSQLGLQGYSSDED